MSLINISNKSKNIDIFLNKNVVSILCATKKECDDVFDMFYNIDKQDGYIVIDDEIVFNKDKKINKFDDYFSFDYKNINNIDKKVFIINLSDDHFIDIDIEKYLIDINQIAKRIDGYILLISNNFKNIFLASDYICAYIDNHIVLQKDKTHFYDYPETIKVAKLIGYQNIFPISKIENNKIYIDELNVVFEKDNGELKDAKYVAIKREDFLIKGKENRYAIDIVDYYQKENEILILFRYSRQRNVGPILQFISTPINRKIKNITHLGINKEDIVLLK